MRFAGLIRWDHTPLQRGQIKTIYIALTSENELFTAIGETTPSDKRADAAKCLVSHLDALKGHANELEWKTALQQAVDDVSNGRATEGLPNDARLHDEILRATAAVLNNKQPILIRRLSAEKLR